MRRDGGGMECADKLSGPRELAHQFNDSGSSAILIHPALLPILAEARPFFKKSLSDDHILLLCPSDAAPKTPYKTIYDIRGSRATPEEFAGKDSRETAWLCYSSGTTGLPKGVQTSHYNLTSQLQAVNPVYPSLVPGRDSILGALPFSHIFGLATLVTQPLTSGVPVVVFPKFDEIPVLAGIQRYKISYGCVVPPIILLLLHSQNTGKFDLTSLKTLQCGAAPLSPELAAAFENKFPHCRVSQGYGLTETTPTITYGKPEDMAGRKGSCGRLIPTYEARLVQEDGSDAPEGGRGELWVRGPSVMTRGYHRNEEATRKTMSGDWFMTGDVAVRDSEGWFTIVDRVKELIKYKGFQVPPAELEALLLTHPDVVDAGVVGVWVEEQATELPRAYIVARPGKIEKGPREEEDRSKFGAEIAQWVAGRVAQHKKLRGGVKVVDAIPKSPSGKILRKDLRVVAQGEIKREMGAKAKL